MSAAKPESPITFRAPALLRRTLDQHLQAHDLVRSRFIRQAIAEKLRRDRKLAAQVRRSIDPPSVFPLPAK